MAEFDGPTGPHVDPASLRPPDEGRIARSWRLLAASWRLLRRDPALLTLAAAGFVSGLGAFAVIFFLVTGGHLGRHDQSRMALIALVGAYPGTFLATFFNVALLSAAQDVLDGRDATVAGGLRFAAGKLGQIAMWSLLAAGVGVLLEQIASRLPLGGRLATWLAGAAWSVITLLAVPILAVEGCGATTCVRRSAALIRGRWGEGIAGRVSITAGMALVAVPAAVLGGIGFGLMRHNAAIGVPLVLVGVAGVLAATIATSAATQVFGLVLYRYAQDGKIEGDFTERDMTGAFKRRRGR